MTPDRARDEFKAKVEKTLDAWLGERNVLCALRYLLIFLACFVIGTVILQVIGMLSHCHRYSTMERRSRTSGRRKMEKSDAHSFSVSLRPASPRAETNNVHLGAAEK
jgi:hypothetical protein